MAGVISFQLTGDSAVMVAATQAAQVAMRGLRISVADINQAFARAAGGNATASDGFNKLKGVTQTATATMYAFSNAFTAFGSQIAPQATAAVLGITNAVTALRHGLSSASISLKTMASTALPFFAPLLGALGIGAIGYQKNQERIKEDETIAQLTEIRTRMMAKIQDMMLRGKLGKEGLNLQIGLQLAPTNVESLSAAIGKVQQRLIGIEIDKSATFGALKELIHLESELKAKSLTGKPRALAELNIEMGDLLQKGEELAKAAKMDWSAFKPAFDAFARQRALEIEKQDESMVPHKPRDLSSWERIGLVFNNGRGPSAESSQQALRVNEAILVEAKKTNQLLSGNSGSNDSFKNR